MVLNRKKTRRMQVLLGAVIVGLLLMGGCSKEPSTSEKPTHPKTEKLLKELTIHGDTRIDEYYWLNERGCQ